MFCCPPYHSELQPIETCWGILKNEGARHCDFTLENLKRQLDHAFNNIAAETCQRIIKKVRTIEERFWEEDARLDQAHENLILQHGNFKSLSIHLQTTIGAIRMGVPLNEAVSQVDDAVMAIFDKDQRVQAVGVGRHDSLFGFHAVRNVRKILPSSASTQALDEFAGIPIDYVDAQNDVKNALQVPATGPGSPTASSFILERAKHRPLVCGLQIQNYDDDDRQGNIANGFITIGTLGCFVELASGAKAILSNNHVAAGENAGVNGSDRIVQPGTTVAATAITDQVATLTDFEQLLISPPGAMPAAGNVNFNDLDVGIVTLKENVLFRQDYLSHHGVPAISGFASAAVGDTVFKVG